MITKTILNSTKNPQGKCLAYISLLCTIFWSHYNILQVINKHVQTNMPTHVVLISFTIISLDHCLVMWSDENSLSIVPLSKIITPPSTKVTAGCSCAVKGFEGFSSWVVAVGTKEEMMGLEKEFIASASPSDTKEKPNKEEAIDHKDNKKRA